MQLGVGQFWAIVIGFVVVAVIGVIWMLATGERGIGHRREVPKAQLRASGGEVAAANLRSIGKRLLWWAPVIVALGGVFGACAVYNRGSNAIVITDKGAERVILMSAPDLAVPMAGDVEDSDHQTIVLNRSSHSVRIEKVHYGTKLSAADQGPPVVVPPHSGATVRYVDFAGPADPPTEEVHSNAGYASRMWLTW